MVEASWLVAQPIAHRGFHDRAAGRWENTCAAADAAIQAGFAIECDVQRSADGEAMVFHDHDLERLTAATGPVSSRSAAVLASLNVGGTAERIPTLPAFLDGIAGQVPLVCEIKSAFDGDLRLVERVAAVVSHYRGPIALKSFDPTVIAHLRRSDACPGIPLGMVAEAHYDDPEWHGLPLELKRGLAALSHYPETCPDFLSFHVADLPHAAPMLFRTALRRPVIAWTVRTSAQRIACETWADQMVFEGFRPDVVPQDAALA